VKCVHSAESLSSSWSSNDNDSLDGDGLFEVDPLNRQPKKQFLDAALKAKSSCVPSSSGCSNLYDKNSIGGNAVF